MAKVSEELMKETVADVIAHFNRVCSERSITPLVEPKFSALAQEMIEKITADPKYTTTLANAETAEGLYADLGRFLGNKLGELFKEAKQEPQIILQRIEKGAEGYSKDKLVSAFAESFEKRNVNKAIAGAVKNASKSATSKVKGANMMGRVGEYVSSFKEMPTDFKVGTSLYMLFGGLSAFNAVNHAAHIAPKGEDGQRHFQLGQLAWAGISAGIASAMLYLAHSNIKAAQQITRGGGSALG